MGRGHLESLLREQEAAKAAEEGGSLCHCRVCGMVTVGPPHGWGTPCPMRKLESEAYVSYYEAARMAALRQGVGAEDMVKSLKQMMRGITGEEDEEE